MTLSLTVLGKSFKHGFTMPKTLKKPIKKSSHKPEPKGKAKSAVKPAAKSVKSAKSDKTEAAKAGAKASKAAPQKAAAPAKGGLVKNMLGKLLKKEKAPIKASKAEDSSKSDAKAQAAKTKPPVTPIEVKSAKKDKPGKKKKDKKEKAGFDAGDDDLLASDEEIGSEDIPDLSEFDENETEEIEEELNEETLTAAEMKTGDDDEIFLTDAEGRRYCRVRDCDQISAVEGYCRYHYLLLWKRIQVRRKILVDGKLERYVEELTARYPDKFLEMIRKDLRTEKDFLGAIAELEIDESATDNEFEDETQNFIDEVRGITTDSGMTEEEEF
jgi:hypothetical protein